MKGDVSNVVLGDVTVGHSPPLLAVRLLCCGRTTNRA